MNKKTKIILQRLDISGISILIWGSYFPVIYYSFYCEFYIKIIYLTLISFMGLVVFFISMQDWIYKTNSHKFRGLMYVSLGLCNVLPMLHYLILS